jgi:F-box protein 11
MITRTVPVDVEWAFEGISRHDTESVPSEYSKGIVGPECFQEVLTRYSPGTLERLPQVTVSWFSDKGHENYLGMAIYEAPEHSQPGDYADETGTVRYFCVPYKQLAAGAVSYEVMYKEFRKIQLPTADRAGISTKLAAWPPGSHFDEQVMEVAALLLTDRPVCILGADKIDLVERLQFIDAVMSLLPYGLRSRLSASTWVSHPAQAPKLRLFFSSRSRPGADNVVIWGRPVQRPTGHPCADDYLSWLTGDGGKPAVDLGRQTELISFRSPDVQKMLERLEVRSASAQDPRPRDSASAVRPAAASPPAADPSVISPKNSVDYFAAFMSYARINDQHDDGRLSQFCARLSSEVQVQTGRRFAIFQDRNDIAWGQNWQERINGALDAATLLVPIITPNFFHSDACRSELVRFQAREQKLGRQDLIMPVYYIHCDEMENPEQHDDIAQLLASRQFTDWQQLRFDEFDSSGVRRAIAALASMMRDAFKRPTFTDLETNHVNNNSAGPAAHQRARRITGSTSVQPRQSVHVVDPYGRGDFTTVAKAIEAADPGDRILVRPGLYQEGLAVSKPLEISGDGPVDEIIIQASGADALVFDAPIGKVSNLTLRQIGGAGRWNGVYITRGRLELEHCDISCQSLSGIGICDGADPRVHDNKIHDCQQAGILVYDAGLGTFENNDIFANTRAGVEIKTNGNPTLRRNAIHNCQRAGVFIYDAGRGTLEDNDIFANASSGVLIKAGGNPTLRRNIIRDCGQTGVSIYNDGRGVLEDNEIFGNAYDGVAIKANSSPRLWRNKISRNGYQALRVSPDSKAVLSENYLMESSGRPKDSRKSRWLTFVDRG